MKKSFTVFLFVIGVRLMAQPYVSVMPAFYTGSGTYAERSTFDFEVGKQWDVFSIGLDLGKTHLTKDSTFYAEIRPNLNVFQQGKFTNTLTIGMGYIFGAAENILTETTVGVEYTANSKWSYNIYFGTYYFSGIHSSSSQNFAGVSIVRFFAPGSIKALFKKSTG